MEEPRMDPRHELQSALGLLVLGVMLIVTLGAPSFGDMGWALSSLMFLIGISVIPLTSLALDRLGLFR